jgi:hypothetical protein
MTTVNHEVVDGKAAVSMTYDHGRVREALDLVFNLPAGEFISFLNHLRHFTSDLREERW